ncbi:prolactin-like [Chiloscyllium punctatum]|uniref:prolactin-like n=1 Tax=Chiloscyllium punctatum TaxID=137246 RepID=UPI003B636261
MSLWCPLATASPALDPTNSEVTLPQAPTSCCGAYLTKITSADPNAKPGLALELPGGAHLSLRWVHSPLMLSELRTRDLLSLLVLVFGVLSKADVIMANPICANEGGECQTISNQHFIQGQHLNFSIINNCHTSSIVTPQNKEDALRTPHERLLSLVIAILRSWQDPLQYVISEFSATHGNTSSILSKSMKIVKQMKQLAKGLNKISEQVLSYYCGESKLQYLFSSSVFEQDRPASIVRSQITLNGVADVEMAPVAQSTGLSRHKNDHQYVFVSKYFSFVFQVVQHSGAIEQTVPWEQPLVEDGDSLISQLYNLLHCFRRDTNKIDTYLKLLKCRFTQR